MNERAINRMLQIVASGLGRRLLEQVAFVGGCVVPLLVTDQLARQRIRATDDVDLIVEVVGRPEYHKFAERLKKQGFFEDPEATVLCRWRYKGVIVDVMPTDESILGFSNSWYTEALETAQWADIEDGSSIRVVQPPYFLATKVEAFEGRGDGDFLRSRDIEDIVSMIDGRKEVVRELRESSEKLQGFVAAKMREYLRHGDFEYAVQSVCQDATHESLLFERIQQLCEVD